MSNETLPPTETPPGIAQIDGTEYEYPYRVTDFHGEVIRDDLDSVPPFLDQEQVDILASALIDQLEAGEFGEYRTQCLASVVEALPDSEHGRGSVPKDWVVSVGPEDYDE